MASNLTVIDPASKPNPLAPPASLNEAGRKLWEAIHRDYVIEDSGGHQMLLRICEAADSLATYDQQIGRDGPTIRTAAGLKEHPLLKHQLATRSFIVRSLLRLNLDVVAPRTELGRPSGGGAYRGEDR
ncbi:hypothetical protein [Bradyrhizobium sp. F1.13.3]|uniref:hypothetical protein n=1 Tax=Bradyrhizobium sp. F1.13.3 TaxID=3156351 RepID=UPI0033938F6E